MVMGYGHQGHKDSGIDRVRLRLAVLAILVVAAFVALFSRLWFLQVLASTTYEDLAKENRVRFIHSEPARGRILDRNGRVLVRSRKSLSVTIDRQVVEPGSRREKVVLRRLSGLLGDPRKELRERLYDATVSPYKPVAVANDVKERHSIYIAENPEDYPGVGTEVLPIRYYPRGRLAAHMLGYVGEISPEDLKSEHFKSAKRPYLAGDLVGKDGLEYAYDRYLRGRPEIRKVIVNSFADVVGSRVQQYEVPGRDLVTSLDIEIQEVTEDALHAGILAARGATYNAPAGAAVVMDPQTGGIIAMASFPDYDPSVLADGILQKEYDALGGATPNDPDDDALLNRATQAMRKPGSTFKAVTAGAALATDIATPYSSFECPGSKVYPPSGGSGSVTFHNWTSAYRGYIGFPEALEHSCNTFFFELGWRMESQFGVVFGDDSERFQKYARRAGLGHETGIDLRYEADGLVPDQKWCKAQYEATKESPFPTCAYGWLPGFTVNMSIGQGDLLVTPIQMATTYAAVANGGRVLQPRIGWQLAQPDDAGGIDVVHEFKTKIANKLPLEDEEIAVIRQGLQQVVTGSSGTAQSVFAGFPLDRHPVAGKTGTAQLRSGVTTLNDAWFVSYAPVDDPEYLVAVYVEEAGHGGTSAGPIARQIWEGIFGLDKKAEVTLGSDSSG
jgi:penicillin-binding protein 2